MLNPGEQGLTSASSAPSWCFTVSVPLVSLTRTRNFKFNIQDKLLALSSLNHVFISEKHMEPNIHLQLPQTPRVLGSWGRSSRPGGGAPGQGAAGQLLGGGSAGVNPEVRASKVRVLGSEVTAVGSEVRGLGLEVRA